MVGNGGENLKTDPTNLVLGILGEVVESRYVKFEFPGLVKFPKTRPEGDEILSGYRDSKTHRGLGDVENSVFVETETVGSIWSVDEFNKISPLHTPVSDRQWRDAGHRGRTM